MDTATEVEFGLCFDVIITFYDWTLNFWNENVCSAPLYIGRIWLVFCFNLFISRDLTVKTLQTFKVLEILKSVGTLKVGLYFNRDMCETLRTGAKSLWLSLSSSEITHAPPCLLEIRVLRNKNYTNLLKLSSLIILSSVHMLGGFNPVFTG